MIDMAKRQPKKVDPTSSQPAKKPKLVKFAPQMLDQIEKLAARNGSDASEEIRIAVRKYLESLDLWPVPDDPVN